MPQVADILGEKSAPVKHYSCGGSIESGVLSISHRPRLEAWARDFKSARVWITFEIGTKRSNEFNRYYFGACRYVAERLAEMGCEGWEADDVHECSKRHCNSLKLMLVKSQTGEMIDELVPKSTRNMSLAQFAEYKEKFIRYWAEQGIAIPDEYWSNHD